jgi:hypothetical protein
MNVHSVWLDCLNEVKAASGAQVDPRSARVGHQLSRGLRTEPYQT